MDLPISPNPPKLPIFLIICLVGLPLLSETIYTPSLPNIASLLHTSNNLVQLTLSSYFMGFAVGVAVWGKLSDHVGRRPAMLSGLLLYWIGSLSCLFSPSIYWLLGSRVIQAFGISVGSVITMTMMRDLYTGKERNQLFSTISMALALAPALGPLIGGFVVQWFHWQANFMVLLSLSLPLLLYCWFFLPETHQHLGAVTNDYNFISVIKKLFTDKTVIICILLVAGFNGILFSYYAEAPFIFINILHYLPGQYGTMGVVIALASMLGAYGSKWLNRMVTAKKIIMLGCLITVTSMLILAINAYAGLITADYKKLALLTLLLPMLGLFVGFGMTIPNVLSIALVNYQKVLGTAGSVFGFSYYVLIGCLLFIMGMIHNGTVTRMPMYFLLLSSLMCIAMFIGFFFTTQEENIEQTSVTR